MALSCFPVTGALTIVLVGRSGTGKSATGNTILGRSAFFSRLQAQPVTKMCQEARRIVAEQDVVVVDTPGLCLMSRDALQLELVRRHVATSGGNTVLVLVLQLGRVVHEDEKVVKMLESYFGKDVRKRMIVLFTRKEDLGAEDINYYCANTDDRSVKGIIGKCGAERVCAFNNNATGQAREDQVAVLLKMARELIGKQVLHWLHPNFLSFLAEWLGVGGGEHSVLTVTAEAAAERASQGKTQELVSRLNRRVFWEPAPRASGHQHGRP